MRYKNIQVIDNNLENSYKRKWKGNKNIKGSVAIEEENIEKLYDSEVKKKLARKDVLAKILKNVTTEFKDYNLKEIEYCIEAEPEISKVSVLSEYKKPKRIVGISTEDIVEGEGRIFYDIRFTAVTSKFEGIKIIVNIEAQNDYHPGYDLVTRGIFYNARQLSAQLETEFSLSKDDKIKYDGLKKVYSIWICTDCPKYVQNTLTT